MIRALCLSMLALTGCSGNGTMMTMTGPDMALPHRMPTDHQPLWGIADQPGIGSVVQSAPEVWTVVWPGDPYVARIEPFISWMLASDYWTGSLKEYGIGAGKSMGVITLPNPAPANITTKDLTDLVAMLVSTGQVPNPTINTNIAFFVPTNTIVSYGGGQSCVGGGFGGFHDDTGGKTPLVFSVIDECDDPGGKIFDGITQVASHELAEAASDPVGGNGFHGPQPLTEIGDLCNFTQQLSFDVPANGSQPAERYWVQRYYSFATAKKGNEDPCLPVPYPRPFFNVTTDPPVMTIGLPANPPKDPFVETFLLEPFAFGDVGKIHWQVINSTVDVQPSSGTVMPGDTVRLTVTLPPNIGFSVSEVDIGVESEKGGSNTWPFYVDACPFQTNCSF